jgi:hypothetical protein
MKKIRFYSSNVGPVKENEIIAIQKAIEICENNLEVKKIVLLIHTQKNTGYLERIFGTRETKKFFNGFKINESLPILKTETIKTINDEYQNKIVLVTFGLRSEELYQYDNYESVVAIIAHQWSEDGVKDWAKTWSAVDILTNEQAERQKLPHKVVQNALNNLTQSINMSTGISHFSDEDLCKTYLRALFKYKYELNSVEINTYLITQLNWQADNVKDVLKLIEKLNSGSYFKGGAKTGLQYYITKWKNEV